MRIGKFDFDFEHDDIIAFSGFCFLSATATILLLTFFIWALGIFFGLMASGLVIGIFLLLFAARVRYNQKKEREKY